VGGAAGALLTGVFAAKLWNPAGADGVLAGNWAQLGTQALATFAAVAYAGGVTFLLVKLVDKLVGLRVDEEAEWEGLDLNLHGEQGYALGGATAHAAPREERRAAAVRGETATEAGAEATPQPARAISSL